MGQMHPLTTLIAYAIIVVQVILKVSFVTYGGVNNVVAVPEPAKHSYNTTF